MTVSCPGNRRAFRITADEDARPSLPREVDTYRVSWAEEYGLEESVAMARLAEWLRHLRAAGYGAWEGRTWSLDAPLLLFCRCPFWEPSDCETMLRSLVSQGVLLVSVRGYAFADERRFLDGEEVGG